MSNIKWNAIKDILGETLELAPPERARFLCERCGEDEVLRREIERYLSYEDKTEAFLEAPALDLLAGLPAERQKGERLGSYRLEGVLAHGGMGVVHQAVRDDGVFQQQVAVKVLKRGLDTMEIVRRFHRERQILATLSHPNVVRVLDGGSTPDGLPFYVMEYVDGMPIDRFCETHRLTVEQRLRLLLTVCEATHSAHQELVVHCDLKPSNVLVTEDHKPMLVDFGIAQILRSGGDTTMLMTGPRLATPGYASPEQLEDRKPTTASDIYSLGALMYRLLTGSPPPREPSVSGLRPSKFPASATAGREDAPLRRRLRGDLDAIVQRATQPNPEERYASAKELAEDLRRHLEHRPVKTRTQKFTYRLHRFLRRRPIESATTVLILGALLILGIQWQLNLLRARALQSAYLELLEAMDPSSGQSNAEAVQEALLKARNKAAQLGKEDRALMFDRFGRISLRMGDLATARDLLQRSLKLRREVGRSEALIADSLNNLAAVALEEGETEQALALLREALALQLRVGSPGSTLETMENTAAALERQGALEAAEVYFRAVLAGKEEVFGRESPQYATSLNNLGQHLLRRDDVEAALSLLEQALELRRKLLGADHPSVATVLVNLGVLRDRLGEFDQAILFHQEALRIRRRDFGEDHPHVSTVQAALAFSYLGRAEDSDLLEAERLFRTVNDVFTEKYGEADGRTLVTRRNLAATLLAQARPAEAAALLAEPLAAEPKAWPAQHWRWADLRSVYGAALAILGQHSEAEPLLREAVPVIAEQTGPESRYTREAKQRLIWNEGLSRHVKPRPGM